MGESEGTNETRSKGVSRYLYGDLFLATCSSRYGEDLAKLARYSGVLHSYGVKDE